MKPRTLSPLLMGLAATWIASMMTLPAQAQSNKTYSITPPTNTNTDQSGNSVAFLKTGKKEYVVSSLVKNQPSGTNNKLMLTKMDASGTPLTAILRDSTWGAERIIETADSGILSISDFPDLVKVTKYDQNLNQLWSESYEKARPANLTAYSAVDVEPAVYEGREHYFITFSEGTYDPVNFPGDEHMGLIRIDQNGNLMWHHFYRNSNRNLYYPPNAVIRDKANSLVSFPNPDDPTRIALAIAGTLVFHDGGDLNPSLFYIVVDDMGNILHQYKKVHTPSDGLSYFYYCPDVQFDGDSLVSSFTQQNTYIGPPPGIFSAYSILKSDIGLSGFRERAFWNSCENRSATLSIIGTGDTQSYLLSGMSGLCDMTSGMSPSFLKVNSSSLDDISFKRYNVNSDVFASTGIVWSCFHRTDNDGYNYFPVDPHLNGYNSWISGFRVLVTNTALNTCGANADTVGHEDVDPSVYDFDYVVEQGLFTIDFSLMETPVQVSFTDCDTATDANYYRTTTVAANSSTGYTAEVFPTLVDQENKVSCRIFSPEATTVEISITDAIGRLAGKEKYNLSAGTNIIQLDTDTFTPGLNLVHIRNGNFHSTTKVNVIR